jgi:hypothetical protein
MSRATEPPGLVEGSVGTSEQYLKPGRRVHKVFLSSTYIDLKDHRAHVIEAVRKAGFSVNPMEDWAADPDEPKSFSRDRMLGCDLCILLVAFRRGHIPENESLSITQMEYRFAVDNGMDVLVFILDDKAPWQRDYDEMATDADTIQWRAELRGRHGVGIFGLDPSSIEVDPALVNWLRRQQASEETVSTSRRIEDLAILMQNDPTVRDQTVEFERDFRDVRDKITVLGDHKELHDLLHDLQRHCFNVIVKEAIYFPDERSQENLRLYEDQLGRLIAKMDEVTSRPSFDRQPTTLMQHLRAARQDLSEAVDEVRPDKLKTATRRLKSLLARQPSKINTQLNLFARELRLDDLVRATTTIGDKVTALGLDADKICEFKDSAGDFDALEKKLQQLVKEHYLWQELDDDLRRIEDLLEHDLDELLDSWPDVMVKMEPLCESITDDQAARFRAEAEGLEAAIRGEHPARIKESFRAYRTLAGDHFYDADKRLHRLCGELRVVGDPLDTVLRILREV